MIARQLPPRPPKEAVVNHYHDVLDANKINIHLGSLDIENTVLWLCIPMSWTNFKYSSRRSLNNNGRLETLLTVILPGSRITL
jgi:hypothetical protein